MSDSHGELELQKPISEHSIYVRNLIPANISENYSINPMFENIAKEDDIRKGIVAFRDFLYLFCDRLITDGYLYTKPKKTKNPADYDFLHNINNMLIYIGNNGEFNEKKDTLLITKIPLFADINPKISTVKQIETLKFLSLCGFVFNDIDLQSKKSNIENIQVLEILYPANPTMLIGLKVLSMADIELRSRRYSNDDNLLRCDYRLIKSEDTDMLEILEDFLYPLPEDIQTFAIELHKKYIGIGMTCIKLSDNAIHFAYAYTKNSKRNLSERDIYQMRTWEFYLSVKHGYCIFVRSKKTDKYEEVIERFNSSLQEKIAKGYGCDRKLRNEICQGGCQGIKLPLDKSIFEIKEDINIWIDSELGIC